MKITMLTSIGFCLNTALEKNESHPFTMHELYSALDKGSLVTLLEKTIDPLKSFSLWAKDERYKAEIENALADASEGIIRGREINLERNPLHTLIDIVFEAIQRQFKLPQESSANNAGIMFI